MSDTRQTSRSEPIIDMGPAPEPAGAVRGAAEGPTVTRYEPLPAGSGRPIPVGAAVPGGSNVDQLARLEDKAARIEEKLARSEAQTQRVVDRFELASARMGDVALQSDLVAVRSEVAGIARRVRSVPGFGALMATAIVTALLTAAIFVAILRYLPQILPPR